MKCHQFLKEQNTVIGVQFSTEGYGALPIGPPAPAGARITWKPHVSSFQPGRDLLRLKDVSKALGTYVLASE